MGIGLDPYNKLLESDLEHVLDHTSDLWDRLKGSTIFITGGTGFFGKWILETFAFANAQIDAGLKVIILSRDPKRFISDYPHLGNNTTFKFIAGDIRNFRYPDGRIDYIIHAATESTEKLNSSEPLEMFDTIVSGTRTVLEMAKEKNPRGLVLTSSGAVYGKQPSHLTHVDEEFRGGPEISNPISAYGEGKRSAELLCSIFYERWNLQAKIARCFAFVGPYLPLDKHLAVGNFIGDAIMGRNISILGDGTPYRSYLYAADLVIWLLTIMIEGRPNRAYNVGSDVEVSILGLAERINSLNPGIRVKVHGKPDKGASAQRYVPSIARARNELNLDCLIGLDEAIRRTFEFNRARLEVQS